MARSGSNPISGAQERLHETDGHAVLRIAIADDEPRMRDWFCKVLPALGHEIVCVAGDGRELVGRCMATMPDLVITDVKMPEMDGIDAAREINLAANIPVILISAYHEAELIERAEAHHVMAYLVKPIKQSDLEPTIAIAMRRYQEFQSLRRETQDLRQALADRKIIEQAKGILMTTTNMDEPSAFRRLQKLASEKNRKLVEIAQMILTATEALNPPTKR